MGEVVEVGTGVKNLKVGDRVVVPFPIACGNCCFCQHETVLALRNSNPNAWMAEKLLGHSPGGIFGYSHLLGGYAGGQAEYARVPFADVGPLKIADGLTDEQVLFLSDIFPTGYMAAETCDIKPGDTVAVWGCGPVGQFAIKSAYLLGAERVIAIDRFPTAAHGARAGRRRDDQLRRGGRLRALKDMTGGRGPDACIDAVGMEAHGAGPVDAYDRAKQAMMLETDRPDRAARRRSWPAATAARCRCPASMAASSTSSRSGALMNRALTIKTGQTHVHRYMRPLLERIQRREIDPSFVITHRLRLDQAPEGYSMFNDKQDECLKVVLKVA